MNPLKTHPSRFFTRSLDPVRSAPGLVAASLLGTLTLSAVLPLPASVVPADELEANKPQIQVTQSGNHLILDWATQPNVYYFMEASPDLSLGTWIPAKLLKDHADTGNLTLGTAMASSRGFYRLSLEGDPDASRLRADDDGDKIINRLEADAGMDAFAPEDPTDSDNDSIPDYFEQFHFGTLIYDGSHIAILGGLTLAEAFANATDPTVLDSDGDGISDAVELQSDSNPNNRLTPPYDFKRVDHADGSSTYTWRSDHGTGDFTVRRESPYRSGNWVPLFTVAYSSLLPPAEGSKRYSVTVDSNFNVIAAP